MPFTRTFTTRNSNTIRLSVRVVAFGLMASTLNSSARAQSGTYEATNATSASSYRDAEDGRRLFTKETFGGNGRTCLTCHSAKTGTVSPQDAQRRLNKDYRDPLFLFDGSDDLKGNGFSRMLDQATILIEIPLPPNVRMGDDPAARSVILARGIPTTLNTPALDPVLMSDGRDPDLPTQALHAIQRHAQVTNRVPRLDLLRISEFEKTEDFLQLTRS